MQPRSRSSAIASLCAGALAAISILPNALPVAGLFALQTAHAADAAPQHESLDFPHTYAAIVHASYRDAHAAAVKLQQAVNQLLAEPSEPTLAAAKQAWIAARVPYSQTEVYRYYEGPIDFANKQTGEHGPELRLNPWPLNEAFIDYVEGNPKAGIIQDANLPLTRETLISKNAADDEANITTGFHAIEFLLWGQDRSLDSAGQRPFTDYTPGKPANDRRRIYLKLVTDLAVDDLAGLVRAWDPQVKGNYREQFLALPREQQLSKLMTGLATLSGFELASERLGVALDSGDQENEQSCFSDNTHNDVRDNAQGVLNIWLGSYGSVKGQGLRDLVTSANPELAKRLDTQLATTQKLAGALDAPLDRTLATPKGSEPRKKVEQLIASLQAQAKLLVEAGKAMGAEVVVAAE